MVKRRSLNDALTPEEEEFINSTEAPPQKRPSKSKPIQKNSKHIKKPEARGQAQRSAALPIMNEMVSLNTRTERRLSVALLRASTERRIQRIEPSSFQAIVSEALEIWLQKAGFLD